MGGGGGSLCEPACRCACHSSAANSERASARARQRGRQHTRRQPAPPPPGPLPSALSTFQLHANYNCSTLSTHLRTSPPARLLLKRITVAHIQTLKWYASLAIGLGRGGCETDTDTCTWRMNHER